MARKCIGIDIGSGSVKIFEPGKEITLTEPAVVAVSTNEKAEFINCGEQAYILDGKRPGAVRIVHPIVNGAVADFDLAEKMLRDMFGMLSLKNFDAVVSVHAGLKDEEKSRILDLVRAAGAESAAAVDASTAAVIGDEFDVSDKRCVMVCDVGSGCTEISIVSGIMSKYAKLLEFGGDSLDEAVATEIKKEYAIALTSRDARMLREKHCMDIPEGADIDDVSVKGLNMITGLPMEAEIDPAVVYDSVYEISDYIAQNVKHVLDGVGGDVASEIRERGLLLCGGASKTGGLYELIADVTGLNVMPAQKPYKCVVEGLGTIVENLKTFEVMLEFKE